MLFLSHGGMAMLSVGVGGMVMLFRQPWRHGHAICWPWRYGHAPSQPLRHGHVLVCQGSAMLSVCHGSVALLSILPCYSWVVEGQPCCLLTD